MVSICSRVMMSGGDSTPLSFLQGFDHGLGDRRTLFSGRRLACRRRYQLAIVTRPDRLKLQCRDDLARVFPARFVALGVELEHCRVDAQLVGDNRDNRLRWNFAYSQQTAQITHQCELDRKAKPIMRPAMLLDEDNILGSQCIARLRIFISFGWFE